VPKIHILKYSLGFSWATTWQKKPFMDARSGKALRDLLAQTGMIPCLHLHALIMFCHGCRIASILKKNTGAAWQASIQASASPSIRASRLNWILTPDTILNLFRNISDDFF
jgi:hypothetical protein